MRFTEGELVMGINNYKLIIRLVLSINLAVISQASNFAYAASERFCDQYTQTAVAQYISNLSHHCKFKGLRWSADFPGQKNWCRKVRPIIAQGETKARRAALTKCGVPAKIRKPWDEIDLFDKNSIIKEAVYRAKADDVRSLQVFTREGVNLAMEWDGNYGTPLFHAIDDQSVNAVKYLIRFDNPNRTSNAGPNPLANMLKDPVINYSLLRYLLQHGANPNSFGELNGNMSIPLPIVIQKGDLRALNELIKYGHADPNYYYEDGGFTAPPLITALRLRNPAIVMALLNAGAKVNKSRSGISCKQIKTVAYNLENNKMPLDYANEMGSQAIINAIKKRGGKTAQQCAVRFK